MFLLESSAEKSFTDLSDLLSKFKDAAFDALKPNTLAVRYAQIEDITRKTTKNISGMFGSSAEALQESSVRAYLDTLKIGSSYEEVLSIQQEIATQQRKALSLTKEEAVAAIEFSKATGIAAKDVGEIVLGFADLGVSTSTALENMSDMTAEARKYGLNVGQFMGTVAKNLTLVNSYGFKNGVEGFTKMVARAQALRIDMTQTTKIASELLNPDKAIELATEFQNLGGAIGDLGDPMKILYMAQNDMNGLQEAIVNAAKSSVMFNKTTGEFKISATEMYRLRAQASALGISYEELSNTAKRAAKETEILSQIRFSGQDEETKQLIANLAEIKNGQVQIKLPGMKDTITDFSNLSKEQLEELRNYQETAALTDRQIAVKQLTTLDNIFNSLTGVKDVFITTPNFQELGSKASEELQKGFEKFADKTKDVALRPEYQTAVQNITTTIKDGFMGVFDKMEKGDLKGATMALGGMISSLTESTGIIDSFSKALKKGTSRLQEGFIPPPPKKTEDLLMGPTTNTVITSPKGRFQLDSMDSVIAGTNLFNKGQENIKKLEFANSAEVRVGGTIQINGIQAGGIGDILLKDPDFQSGIKNLFSKSFKEQLGTA